MEVFKLLRTHLAAFSACALVTLAGLSNASANSDERNEVPRKFDEYGYLTTDDEAARLDAFFEVLRKQSDLSGFIVGYNQPQIARGIFLRRIFGDQNYLVEARGIMPDRMLVMDGGYRAEYTIELWLVPTGAVPPTVIPTLPSPQMKARASYKFDEECLECAPAVNLHLYGLGQGIKFYAEELHKAPQSRGLIIAYPSTSHSPRAALNDAKRAKRLLVEQYRIDAQRIIVKLGRRREVSIARLWIVPKL